MDKAVSELVIVLGLLGLASIEWRTWSKQTLIVFYGASSFIVAGLADMQAGGAENYYFELLFAIVPIAVLGVFQLMDLARRNAMLGLALTSVLIIHFVGPRALEAYDEVSAIRNGWVTSGNTQFRQLANVLQGHRVFSGSGRLALLDPEPPLMEPYLLSYLHRLDKVDLGPILEPLARTEYELAITGDNGGSWRGVKSLDPGLRDTIAHSYRPYCTLPGLLFHLPRDVDPASNTLAQDLGRIGCLPVGPNDKLSW